MFRELLDGLKADLKTLLMSRLVWFIGGIFGSGQDVPSIVDKVKSLFGL